MENVLIRDARGAVGTSKGFFGGGGREAKLQRARKSWPVMGVRNGQRVPGRRNSMCEGLEVHESLFSIAPPLHTDFKDTPPSSSPLHLPGEF